MLHITVRVFCVHVTGGGREHAASQGNGHARDKAEEVPTAGSSLQADSTICLRRLFSQQRSRYLKTYLNTFSVVFGLH